MKIPRWQQVLLLYIAIFGSTGLVTAIGSYLYGYWQGINNPQVVDKDNGLSPAKTAMNKSPEFRMLLESARNQNREFMQQQETAGGGGADSELVGRQLGGSDLELDDAGRSDSGAGAAVAMELKEKSSVDCADRHPTPVEPERK